ncbi:MAG TPA: hypothetical protein VIO64_05190 [Pseudobacteroides sp.]|uniref:hypothetical protein n=1 Tax=Pseudobacteroides sp. TaxID=1968840 RepID=UPI002F9533BB
MKQCICSSCINLKGIINEDGAILEYECEFGYPSEDCLQCEAGECELSCSKYISDDEPEETIKIYCSKCNKELSQASKDSGEGQVFCVNCYLNI